jgi:hypothetical protein
MKSTVILISIVMSSLSLISQAKPQYTLFEEKRIATTAKAPPRVSAYDCSNCIFDDGINSVCLDHSVSANVGWEFTQDYTIYSALVPQYYYKLRAQPYV